MCSTRVFDALIDFEPQTLELKPGLAKCWKFTDPKTLVLELVEGVKFHDGTPSTPTRSNSTSTATRTTSAPT